MSRKRFMLSPGAEMALTLMTDNGAVSAHRLVSELILEEYTRRRAKPVIEDQSHNGVRVLVHRYPDGSTHVDATCKCFGLNRAHSNPDCPTRKSP